MENMKKLVDEAKDYYEVKKKVIKLKAADALSESAGNTVAYIALAVIGLFTLMFFSISLALGLGWALGNNLWGFLIVTAIYITAGIVVYYRKEQMIRIPILNGLLKSLFKEESLTDGTSKGNKAA